ncbi:hypothetical protein KKG90_08255 [Candidatus Bipolaricaulota bacterium]|nr:hypothetical protein [Candidatus Bipolaricaulota bacterium]
MKIRLWNLLALTFALCLILTACSSNSDTEQATTSTHAADLDPVATSAPEATVPAAQPQEEAPTLASVDTPPPSAPSLPVDVEVTVDSETGLDVGIDIAPQGIFAGATAALQALQSYRFTTSFLFTGQEDGTIESGSIELSGEIMDAQRKHFTWKNLEDGEQFEIIQLENEAWIFSDEEWESVPALVADAMGQAVLVFAPSAVWGGLFGGMEADSIYVGPETVDGVPAHHYTSSYRHWAGVWQGEVLDATGDVWIAEAGYPLRYDFTATAVDEDGNQGTVTWSMVLTDAGADIVIEPPATELVPM